MRRSGSRCARPAAARCAGSSPRRSVLAAWRCGRRWPTRARPRARARAEVPRRRGAGGADGGGHLAARAPALDGPRWCRCRCTRGGAGGAASTRRSASRGGRAPRRPAGGRLPGPRAARRARQVGRDRVQRLGRPAAVDRAGRRRPPPRCWWTTCATTGATLAACAAALRTAGHRAGHGGRLRPDAWAMSAVGEHAGWQRHRAPTIGATPIATEESRMRIEREGAQRHCRRRAEESGWTRSSPRSQRQVSELADMEVELIEERNPAIRDSQVVELTLHLKGVTLEGARGVRGHGQVAQHGRGRPLPPGQAPPREAPQAPRGAPRFASYGLGLGALVGGRDGHCPSGRQ